MAYNPSDPFDTPFDDWDDDTSSSRRAGRPSSRRNTAKSPNGRPRIRPLADKYSRRRGRPAGLQGGDIGDRIEKEALLSGSYGSKSYIGSVKGLEKSVTMLQKGVITPLAKSVSAFSNSVNKFNAYHQQYLKDQMAISKEMHETFRLFRKASIDPLLRNLAKAQRGTRVASETFKEVYDSGYQGREYKELVRKVQSIDNILYKSLQTGVVATEATDTFLKEYYKTSKGTSKFLNSVAYAAEDIAEDIEALKGDLNKYFKGKNNKSVLVDQTETLRKIEKNTAAPTVGKRIVAGITGALVAAGKTAFKYNRYGTSQLIAEMTGIKLPSVKSLAEGSKTSGIGKIAKVFADAYDVAIREKVRDENGVLRSTYMGAQVGMYGPAAQRFAESAESIGRGASTSVRNIALGIKKAWDESQTKKYAKWFMEVGAVTFLNEWEKAGIVGERSINATITNYGTRRGDPHPGNHTNDILDDVLRILRKSESGKYQYAGGKVLTHPTWSNRFRNSLGLAEDYTEDYAQPLDLLYDPISRASGKSVFAGGTKTAKAKAQERWGKGSNVVSFESKSESDMNSADVSDPKRAFGSLAKLQGRAVGYLKKIWMKTKQSGSDLLEKGKDSGWLGKAAAAGGLGWLARNLLKNRKFLKGKAGGLSLLGGLIFGSHALKKGFAGSRILSKHKLASGLGSTARVLWDTFGWGATKGKGHMGAIGAFKNTRLGQSALGTWIRKSALAAAGKGTDIGSRLLGGAIHAGKWGGGPLGAAAGLWHGLGVKVGKEGISLAGRQAISSLGGVAAKAGTRTRNALNAAKAAAFTKAHPMIAKVAGTGFLGKAGAAIASPIKGIGKMMAKIPAKDKVLGGLLGGAGAKLLAKTGGKGVAKALAKQIPILGAIVGIGFGIHRFTKGDVLGGILEIVSGLLTLVPSGAGNAAALGIDAFLIGRDIHKATKGDSKKSKKAKQQMQKDKMAKGMGLGPNPSAAQVMSVAEATANAAKGSEINHVSNAQKTVGESGYISSGYSPGQAAPQKLGFFGSVGKAISKAGSAVKTAAQVGATYFTPTAGGEKKIVTKDTGAINWNGKRHDKLMPKFKQALYSAADEFYKKTGQKVNITSAIRTDEEQAYLYYRWKNGDKNIMTPALPVNDYPQYGIRGTHNNNRSGHLVGGAVDISNWKAFKPYAAKYGLHWQGAKDPVHFQINDRGPVITNAASKPVANKSTAKPTAGKTKVGDGDTYMASPSNSVKSVGSGSATPSAGGNVQTEVSPMIQDYGLAIINNLLFA